MRGFKNLLCYDRYSSGPQTPQKGDKYDLPELEPMKLPGTMGQFTGNVMYPNDESAVWDVDRKEPVLIDAHPLSGQCFCLVCRACTWQDCE